MGLFGKNAHAINLALQGGGAHGAFTWGVLDRLLEEPSIEISAISGTSAGALNAVALASGFERDGALGARETLREVWMAVRDAAPPDLGALNPFQMGREFLDEIAGASAEQMAQVFSPSQLNPMNIDPLREIVETQIDFKALGQAGGIKLFLAATNVSTGRARVFENHELSVDVVMASACLPTVQRAVQIGDEYYWDGGFSANPDLGSLILKGDAEDSLLVQLEPSRVTEVPKSARNITNHMNWMMFNQPLHRELGMIQKIRATRVGLFSADKSRIERYKQHRFHHIDGGEYLAALPLESKIRPDAKNLKTLFEAGQDHAERFLADSRSLVGKRSSVDLMDLI